MASQTDRAPISIAFSLHGGSLLYRLHEIRPNRRANNRRIRGGTAAQLDELGAKGATAAQQITSDVVSVNSSNACEMNRSSRSRPNARC